MMSKDQAIDNTVFSIVTPKGVKLLESGEKVFSTTYIAKQYRIPRNKFMSMLLLLDVAYYRFNRHLPKRYLIEKGYFVLDKLQLKHTLDGTPFKVTRGWWTVSGSKYLAQLIKRRFMYEPRHVWYDD